MKAILFACIFFLAGCMNQGVVDHKVKSQTKRDQTVTTIVDKLHVPWSITKHKETFYISERNGTIVSWNTSTQTFKRVPVHTTKPIHREGEGGLLGLELFPNFDESHQAFAYHTYKENGIIQNRVIIIRKDENVWNEVNGLLEGIPGSAIHDGGRIKIGPDHNLYVTAGDASVSENAQNLQSLSGKILRMEQDGKIPVDNPFPNSYVYSYGHRNPQGLAWDKNGTLYSTEHGQSAHDEINVIQPGHNYGWPIIEGDESKIGLEKPLFQTGETTWAPSGIQYKDGKLYIANLRGEALRIFKVKTKKYSTVKAGQGRIRDVYIDGENLYMISNNLDGRGTPSKKDDRLYKIKLGDIK